MVQFGNSSPIQFQITGLTISTGMLHGETIIQKHDYEEVLFVGHTVYLQAILPPPSHGFPVVLCFDLLSLILCVKSFEV